MKSLLFTIRAELLFSSILVLRLLLVLKRGLLLILDLGLIFLPFFHLSLSALIKDCFLSRQGLPNFVAITNFRFNQKVEIFVVN